MVIPPEDVAVELPKHGAAMMGLFLWLDEIVVQDRAMIVVVGDYGLSGPYPFTVNLRRSHKRVKKDIVAKVVLFIQLLPMRIDSITQVNIASAFRVDEEKKGFVGGDGVTQCVKKFWPMLWGSGGLIEGPEKFRDCFTRGT